MALTTYWTDLHLHSHFAWATSRTCTLPHYWQAAQWKGIRVIGTGDITHPAWLHTVRTCLRPASNGLWDLDPAIAHTLEDTIPRRCRGTVQFMLSGEVNCVYRRGNRARRVHHLIFLSCLDRAQTLQQQLAPFGRLEADGRPTLRLDSRELLAILMDVDDHAALVPAHIWTPWYSLLGSKSGFDSVTECFGDLAAEIRAVETGLSADPGMLAQTACLQPYLYISNSDAHSPAKLGREVTALRGTPSYDRIWRMLRGDRAIGPASTIEWPPALGKYYWDGHRKCRIAWSPDTTGHPPQSCPVCSRPITRGVLSRVQALSSPAVPDTQRTALPPSLPTIPLPDLIAHVLQRRSATKAVRGCYHAMLDRLGPELAILHQIPEADLIQASSVAIAQAIMAMRQGNLHISPGFDGQFGQWTLATDRCASSSI